MDFQSIALPSELRYPFTIASANIGRFLIYAKQLLKKINGIFELKKLIMILTIDIGNSKIKVAVFKEHILVLKLDFDKNNFQNGIETIFKKYSQIQNTIISSVSHLKTETKLFLENKTTVFYVNQEISFPYANNYKTPQTLGVDRKVLVAGAVLKYPSQNCLVIDAGSCITYDFVDAQKNYWGGAISPGLTMRYRAMHQFTAKLPLLQPENPMSITGASSNHCMHSGVVYGVVFEMEGFMNNYLANYQDLTIILTGGDALFLAKRFKNTIFAQPNFLLESLNLLFQFNTNDK